MQQVTLFQAPTKLIYGPGTVERIGPEIGALAIRKVLVCTDKGVAAAGILERVLESLKASEIDCVVFDEVEPNPSIASAERALGVLKREGCQATVGIGGGSSMDTAKAVSLWAQNPGRLQDYEGADKAKNPCLPNFAIPTTAGTGSEVSAGLVVTDTERKYKLSIRSSSNLPRVGILDPSLMSNLPAHIAAACGMDALTHAIEAYISTQASPITDGIALGSIRLVGENLRQFVARRSNVEAAGKMLWASTMGAMAFVWARLGIAHAMAHPLGGHFNIAHGLANAIVLPHVMRYNLIANPQKFAVIASALGEHVDGLKPLDAAERSVLAVERLMEDIGITQRLSALGVTEESIPTLSEDAMKTGMAPTSPRTIDAAGIAALYRQAL